ncbi:Transmembrane protein 65 [Lotmaria passim]
MQRFLSRRALSRSPVFVWRCFSTSPLPRNSNLAAPSPAAATAARGSLTPQELQRIAHLIENDPRILMEVVASMDPQSRRRLVVTGGAMEWFGTESAAQEVEKADADKDRQISPKDFDHWFESALKRRQEGQKKRVTETKQPTSATTAAASKTLPLAALFMIALEAGLPFVGFGFLDNATMILAGDLIDGTLGFYLNCSVLASAAMGNVCSGMLGMQVHGLIDKAVQKLNFNMPVLTEEQMRDRRVFLAGHLGGTIGIMAGLVLGMLPLLFLDGDTTEKSDYAMFHRWDVNNSGFIELPEFEKVLREIGLGQTDAKAKVLIEKYGENNRVNFEQFAQLKTDLREGKPIFD